MSRRVDLVTLGVAVAVHAGLAIGMVRGRAPSAPRASTVELDFHDPPPAPPPAAAPPAAAGPAAHAARPPAARRRVAVRERPAPAAAVPERAAPAPAPPQPMFAVAMASTSEVAVPSQAPAAASITAAGRGPGGHGAAGSLSGGDGGGAAADSDVARMPEVDADACGRAIAYPADAEAAGIEGDVRLRVSLTAEGRVSAVRVLSGLGHGLDQAAAEALRTRCRFSPAVDRAGKPVAFVIRSYTFHFQLPGR